MAFTQTPLAQFLDALAEGTPAPGGGSAAAVAAACGAALVEMVCRLSSTEDPRLKSRLTATLEHSQALRSRLTSVIDRDPAAYAAVIQARRMRGTSDEEVEAREGALSSAWRLATEVPLEMARDCLEVMQGATWLRENGKPRVAADAEAAELLADAGMRIALANIRTNVVAIRDQEFVNRIRAEAERLEGERLTIHREGEQD